jgi:hypothetical protein
MKEGRREGGREGRKERKKEKPKPGKQYMNKTKGLPKPRKF